MVVASIHESQTDLELEPPSYENATSPSNQNNSENDVQAKTGIDREAYWQKVRLVANLIPTTLDHVSDILGMLPFLFHSIKNSQKQYLGFLNVKM